MSTGSMVGGFTRPDLINWWCRMYGLKVAAVVFFLLIISVLQPGRDLVTDEKYSELWNFNFRWQPSRFLVSKEEDCEDNPALCCPVVDNRVDITNLSVSQSSPETSIGGGYCMLLNQNFSSEPEQSYCVPKKIHFLWIGDEIPEKYQKNIKTFVNLNPDYEIFLWTETISLELIESMPNVTIQDLNKEIANYTVRDLYEAERNVGAKSDILRYEVVYRNGGVYYDTDSVCEKPLNDLLTHSFVSPRVDAYQNIQNSVFGFPKGSKFLEFVFRALRWNIAQDPDGYVPVKSGPCFFCGVFLMYNDTNVNMISQHNIALGKTNISITYQTYDANWVDEA